MSLRDEIRKYTQSDGLVSPDLNPSPDSTGNGLSYLSLYHLLLTRLSMKSPEDYTWYIEITDKCLAKSYWGFGDYHFQPGCYNRSATKDDDQNGPDDYVLMCLNSLNVANNVYTQGKLNFWKYNNASYNQFSWKAWFGWRPQIVAHFHWCALMRPGILLRAWWCVNIIFTSVFQIADSTSTIQAWALVETANKDHAWLVRLASWVFRKRLKSHWGTDTIKGALAAHLGPQHPIAVYWE